MAVYKNFDSLVNGLKRSIDLSTNTLAVGNIQIGGETNYANFDVSAVTGAKTITMPNTAVDLGVIATTASGLSSHVGNTSNPHSVTKAQVGLTNVTDDAQVKKIAVAVDADIAVFDGTTGALIKDSGTKVADLALVGHNHSGVYEPANSNIQSHISSTSNPHSVTKAQVGLTNVTDDAQLKAADLDTDNTLSANSDSKISSQKAVKAYVASQIGGSGFIPSSEKGANSGVATLDAGGKVPAGQLPNSVMTYEGTFDASATPAAPLLNGNAGANAGMVYLANVAGSYNFGAGAIVFAVGDWAVYSGSIWEKSLNSNAVVSVAGQTGVVTLAKGDVGLGNVDNTSDANKPVSTATQTALNGKSNTGHGHVAADISDFTSAAKAAAVSDAIVNGVTDVAPSQNAVFDALALKADTSTVSTISGKVDDLVTLSGVAANSANLGTFTGSTIADNSTVKTSLQALETKVELVDAKDPFSRPEVAGESFAANKTFICRFAVDGETLGRSYKADCDAGAVGSETNKIYCAGVASNVAAKSAADAMSLELTGGIVNLQSGDTPFSSTSINKPLYLGTAGAFSVTPPSAANSAVVIVGIVKTTTSFQVASHQIVGVN